MKQSDKCKQFYECCQCSILNQFGTEGGDGLDSADIISQGNLNEAINQRR